ncbi:MAG TPA: glycosyltransferase, partial [Flavobacteriales bacterium]|nr:glycosyltransferase [Flavobacteriales bacterium]
KAKGARCIYHVVDPYQSFPEDERMARAADLMVTVNLWFLDHYASFNRRRLLVRHGVRTEDRLYDPVMVEQWRRTYGRYALFAASLSDFTNFNVLIRAAGRFPAMKFLVVGRKFPLPPDPEIERDRFLSMPNVEYLGVKHPDELRDLVRGATVGLLAYDFEIRRSVPLSGGRTPLKVLTYLAQHCPLVTTNNSFIPDLDEKGCFKADDTEEFLRKMSDVIDGRLTVDTAAVDRYLDGMDYRILTARILRALDQVSDSA